MSNEFRILLDRFEQCFRETQRARDERHAFDIAIREMRTQNYEYRRLVQQMDKALAKAKVGNRPSLPGWHLKAVKDDEDVPF